MKRILPIRIITDNGLVIFPTIIQDEKQVYLVDCGPAFSKDKIEEALKKEGLSIADITKIIITHHDHDHMGAVVELVEVNPNIKVITSKIQLQYVKGEKASLRASNPDFKSIIESMRFPKIADVIQQEEMLSVYDGVEVLDTKGHMPGHISLYIKKEKALITGDAIATDGKVLFFNEIYMLDIEEGKKSLRQIFDYEIETVICFHGGVFKGDFKKAIKKVIGE